MKPKNYRINNLMFRPATYLGDPPKHPSWSIDKFVPNKYFGKESEYTYHEDGYYTDPEWEAQGIHCKISKDCFKHPETCYSIASFEYDPSEPCWELKFIGNRPMYLSEDERNDFWELIIYGYDVLNDYSDEE